MIWNWSYTWSIMPPLLRGLRLTVEITLIASAGALALGVPVALTGRDGPLLVRIPLRFVLEFVRGTPLIIQLFFAYYVMPQYGVTGSALTVGTIVLAVNYTPYASEVYRAGIDGVPRDQWEAAHALQLSRWRTWKSVILPPAIRKSVPPLVGYVVAMYKDTAALFVLGIPILFAAAQSQGLTTYRYVEPYTIAGAFYLLVSYASSVLLRRLEYKK